MPTALRLAIRRLITAEAPWPLVLTGPPGVGKTCGALVLLDYSGGAYYTVRGLNALMIQSQHGRLEWTHEGRGGTLWPEKLWAKIAREPLVVLDELGVRGVTDFHYENVQQLIEERNQRPLVVISNSPLADLARVYDDRIASRMAAGTVLHLEGDDLRLQS